MSTAIQTVSPETYLSSSHYEPDAEFVDGVIEQRAVSELDHAAWQDAILSWFRLRARDWNIRVYPGLRVQVSPSRFRVPDAIILDRNQPLEQIIRHAPIAVFEVLSPEDSMVRVMRKLNDYQGMGIPEIWLVNTETRQWFRFEHDQAVLRTQFSRPGMTFLLTEIEALVDL